MSFLNLEYSIFFLAPIVLFLFDAISGLQKKQKVLKLATSQRWQLLVPNISNKKYLFKKILLYIVLIIFPLVLMEPVFGKQNATVVQKNIDIVFLVDVSLSMLAEDVKPSRLERTKIEVQKIVKSLEGERVALAAFSKVAAVILPLTQDYSAFNRMLNTLTPNTLSRQGTSLESALLTAKNIFQSGRQDNHKVVLVVSDGENHNSSISRTGALLQQDNIVVNAIGIGTKKGAGIPLKNPITQSVKLLESYGNIVITKLNEDSLKEIADLTNGYYTKLEESPHYIEILMNAIEQNKTVSENTEEISINASRYKIPLIVILVLLAIEALMPHTKRKRKPMPQPTQKNKNPLKLLKNTGIILPFTLIVLLSTSHIYAQSPLPNPFDNSGKKAAELMEKQEFAEAAKLYESILAQEGESIELLYNLALAKSQVENVEINMQATKHFENAIKQLKLKNPKHSLLESLYYNLGNLSLKIENFPQASLAYINSLRINPNNENARFNLEIALKHSQSNQSDEQKKQQEEQRKSQSNESSKNSESEPSKQENDKTKNDFASNPSDEQNNNSAPGQAGQKKIENQQQINRQRADEILKKVEEKLKQQRQIGEHQEFSKAEKLGKPW